jgi:hypothetical protein
MICLRPAEHLVAPRERRVGIGNSDISFIMSEKIPNGGDVTCVRFPFAFLRSGCNAV